VLADCVALRAGVTPAQAILNDIDLAAGWADLEPETLQIGISQEDVFLAGLGRVDRPFRDLSPHAGVPSLSARRQSHSNHQQ